MDATERAEVLRVVSDLQNDGGMSGTAPVIVQIGGISNTTDMVEHESLYIKNAPSLIISELTGMGYNLSVEEDGVRIR